MTERMDDWNPPESWKRITCIVMICTGHQNKESIVIAKCSLNTVKTIKHELENCNGDSQIVFRRKQYNRRFDGVCSAEFLAFFSERVSGLIQMPTWSC